MLWLDVGCEEKSGIKHDFMVSGLSKKGVDMKWDGEVSGEVWRRPRILFLICKLEMPSNGAVE